MESNKDLQNVLSALSGFLLISKQEYENLINMLSQEIYEIDEILVKRPDDNDEKTARDELVLLRAKIEYIISNGLHTKQT